MRDEVVMDGCVARLNWFVLVQITRLRLNPK